MCRSSGRTSTARVRATMPHPSLKQPDDLGRKVVAHLAINPGIRKKPKRIQRIVAQYWNAPILPQVSSHRRFADDAREGRPRWRMRRQRCEFSTACHPSSRGISFPLAGSRAAGNRAEEHNARAYLNGVSACDGDAFGLRAVLRHSTASNPFSSMGGRELSQCNTSLRSQPMENSLPMFTDHCTVRIRNRPLV